MKLLHIVRKDLRRLRAWLIAWITVVALPMLLGVMLLARNPLGVDDGKWPEDLHHAWLVVQGVLAYLLTLVVLQADPLMGTRQFWLTRPIGAGRLLAAKAVALVLILGVSPLAVMLPWWLWCGLGAVDIAVVAMEWCGLATLVALPAALVAVLTDTLARSLLWTMVLVAAVPVAGLFFNAAAVSSSGGSHSSALVISRLVLGVGACALVFAVVIVVQFRVRCYGWWLAAAGTVILVSLGIASQWPKAVIGRQGQADFNPERARSVEVQWRRTRAERLPAGRVDTPAGLDVMQRIETEFLATGVPKGTWLSGVAARQQWRLGEAFELKWLDSLDGGGGHALRLGEMKIFDWAGDEETQRWRLESLRRKNLPAPAPPQPPFDGSAELRTRAFFRPSLVARMLADSPAYDAHLWLKLQRPVLDIEMPIAPGRWHVEEGRALRIDAVRPEAEAQLRGTPVAGWSVVLVETRPAPLSERLRASAERDSFFRQLPGEEREGYVLVNRAGGELEWQSRHSEGDPREWVVSGVRIRWHARWLRLPRVVRDGKWVLAPGWTSEVSLGRVTFRDEAAFRREVKVDRLPVQRGETNVP